MSLEDIKKARLHALKTLDKLILDALTNADDAAGISEGGSRPNKIRYIQLAGTLLKIKDEILTRMEDSKLSEDVAELEKKQVRIDESLK